MTSTRRQFAQAAAGLAGWRAAAAEERYQLGCQTLPYRAQPLARALEGIRKAGYRYVMPNHSHAGKPAFSPALDAAGRASLRRQIGDAGLAPFMSFVGLTADIRKPEGLDTYMKELDLCAEFGIRTVVGIGPWYYDKFPTVPKRARDWEIETREFYAAQEKGVRRAEQLGITIAVKPHTGITANAKACLEVVRRIVSDRFQICWDAGNVSFYEGIHPDPDLPDLAPHVKAVCIKDHKGMRAEANFPTPGEGQVDHDLMFRILFSAGFRYPIAVERVDGTDDASKMDPDLIDRRIAAARNFLVPILDKYASKAGARS
ncbi:MAG: sugar phosphate isomerase/epimerase [Bryobacteraceae bacterium]|nr:sugar phosphate isomerase/epimerase [Bryobacteraceae bacterium]